MYAKVHTAVLHGVDGVITGVEADLHNGLPAFHLVGLPDAAVREAKERIHAAIANSGQVFPSKRITVNLSPANIRKEGTHLDLPIGVSILAAMGKLNGRALDHVAFLGELSLDGRICGVTGMVPLLSGLYENGIRNVVIPYENIKESSIVRGIRLLPVKSVRELTELLQKQKPGFMNYYSSYKEDPPVGEDCFDEICGQEFAKRAIEIGAAGRHNMLFVGPPGSGKTMLAKRIPTVLPPLHEGDCLEVTKIYSAAGLLTEEQPLICHSPFRQPHHTASAVSLVGGGAKPRPGEVSLAHKGVLFLDEFPEFTRQAMEVLRQPMEQKEVHIARAGATITFPADFMLVVAMNPCPCGYFGQGGRVCTCTEAQMHRYAGKISGPLLDRMDLQVGVDPVSYEQLHKIGGDCCMSRQSEKGWTSRAMAMRIQEAIRWQEQRYEKETVHYNGNLTLEEMEKYCVMDRDAKDLLKVAFEKNLLSARAYHKVIKVARTIADLEQSNVIAGEHMAEAIGYRCCGRTQ